jgi:uncharacterized protein with HEPN domain
MTYLLKPERSMRRDALLLAEIVGAIERILEISHAMNPAEVDGEPDQRDALLWNFTVLGEAANQLSTELKSQSPDLPWVDASRTRNRIVHGYWSVDFDVLAAIARDDLPTFLVGVRSLLREVLDAG